jgi:hypothetical protein
MRMIRVRPSHRRFLGAFEMRSWMIIALAAVVALMLIARDCSERRDNVATKGETTNSAADAKTQPTELSPNLRAWSDSTAGAVEAKAQPAEFSLSAADDEGVDLPEREEIRQSRKLTPGTKVFVIGLNDARVDSDGKEAFVMGINGGVKVETADTDTAEVLIVRSAHKREDLLHRKVNISNDENLFIRIEDDSTFTPRRTVLSKIRRKMFAPAGDDSAIPEIRERVILKLPRKAGLEIHVVYGAVTIGETEGRLEIRNVDGPIRVARAAGLVEVSNVNGPIDITFAPLAANSINIGGGVNGDINLRFEGEVNADLNAWSVIGAIKPDFPNVETRRTERGWWWASLKARIGNGGLGIEVHGVNGNVTLSKAASSAAPAAQ